MIGRHRVTDDICVIGISVESVSHFWSQLTGKEQGGLHVDEVEKG